MRLRASLGGLLLLALAACETIPETVKVEIDGHTLEIKRKSPPTEPSRGEQR